MCSEQSKKGTLAIDQFYTQPDVAKKCINVFNTIKNKLGDIELYIEPSAGAGDFLRLLPKFQRIGLDISPASNNILKMDFLSESMYEYYCTNISNSFDKSNIVVVGNPPFGHRSDLAIQFLLRASFYADHVAFILPVHFNKYAAHNQLPPELKLVWQDNLSPDSFYKPDNSPYSINTVFQIWTRKATDLEDLRIRSKPDIHHSDFIIWAYNITSECLYMFDEDWDIAIPCQGWQDYERRETDANRCEKHKHWMFIKIRYPPAREFFERVDLKRLAFDTGTIIPGFRKADLVRLYKEKTGRIAKTLDGDDIVKIFMG